MRYRAGVPSCHPCFRYLSMQRLGSSPSSFKLHHESRTARACAGKLPNAKLQTRHDPVLHLHNTRRKRVEPSKAKTPSPSHSHLYSRARFTSLSALALAALSNSAYVPLFRHMFLNMPSSFWIRFSGVSNSATCPHAQHTRSTHRNVRLTSPLSNTINRS